MNAMDYNGYPDCRPEYIEAFQKMVNLTIDMTIHAPLINLKKHEIIKKGRNLGLDFELTFSCYDPDVYGYPCGQCDACHLRQQGFDASK